MWRKLKFDKDLLAAIPWAILTAVMLELTILAITAMSWWLLLFVLFLLALIIIQPICRLHRTEGIFVEDLFLSDEDDDYCGEEEDEDEEEFEDYPLDDNILF